MSGFDFWGRCHACGRYEADCAGPDTAPCDEYIPRACAFMDSALFAFLSRLVASGPTPETRGARR